MPDEFSALSPPGRTVERNTRDVLEAGLMTVVDIFPLLPRSGSHHAIVVPVMSPQDDWKMAQQMFPAHPQPQVPVFVSVQRFVETSRLARWSTAVHDITGKDIITTLKIEQIII